MTLLTGCKVAAIGAMRERPLARYFASLGAGLVPIEADEAGMAIATTCDILIDGEGLDQLAARGWQADRLSESLIHVSVSTFGSGGPRALWKGGELIASAAGGTLRLTGQPDRAPVKEALDACTFHADMAGAPKRPVMRLWKHQPSASRQMHLTVAMP